VIDKVAANNFYKDRGDKIKQNWSLYEFSNIMYSKIEEHPELAGYRKKHSESDIAAFCVYFSKRLRQSLENLHTKRTSSVVFDARYIYEFYPGNTRAQTQRLLEAASEAWEDHIMSCSVCPNQCLSDGYAITDMFDNLEKTGWPTL
jgi:hypothetical protein